jgi:type I restriction enzyme M protein
MSNQAERAELHKTIWKIANDLRGSVDGWEFKAYVLGSIFYRFISEYGRTTNKISSSIE